MRASRILVVRCLCAAGAMVLAACADIAEKTPTSNTAAAKAETDPWTASTSAAARKNPLPMNPATIAAGKAIYAQQCSVCHGASGKGNGPAAPAFSVPVADLTSSKVQQQSDGALFWKIGEGHSPMPSFSSILPAQQRWEVVDYIRSLRGQ